MFSTKCSGVKVKVFVSYLILLRMDHNYCYYRAFKKKRKAQNNCIVKLPLQEELAFVELQTQYST